MKIIKNIKLHSVFFIMFIMIFLLIEGCSSFPEQPSTAQINQEKTSVSNKPQDIEILRGITDLCLYQNPSFNPSREKENPDSRLYNLINAGYPKDISLEEAIAIFNKFAQCDDRGKTQPPLTVEEVKAAIRDWDCKKEGDAEDKKFCADVWKIAETGKMPKGSFFDFDNGTGGTSRVRGYRGYYVKTWEIELYLHLDKYRRDLRDVPEFAHSIKLKYLSSEKRKDVQW